MKVQLNHQGSQKRFSINNGYFNWQGNFLGINHPRIVRNWNIDQPHFRKFLTSLGAYIDEEFRIKNSKLYFWGEWEGYSFFEQYLNNGDPRILPNGLHEPFHSTHDLGVGTQNTDPFVFGKSFKYATCKQRGALCNLPPNSIIVFGTTYPSLNCFYVDTVFVFGENGISETAIDVHGNNGLNYSQIFIEETLQQPNTGYINQIPSPHKRLYHGQTWHQNSSFFSFVPCKTNTQAGFERLKLDLNYPNLNLNTNPTGISYLPNCPITSQQIWQIIVDECFKQGFVLGFDFPEPPTVVL